MVSSSQDAAAVGLESVQVAEESYSGMMPLRTYPPLARAAAAAADVSNQHHGVQVCMDGLPYKI